MPDAWPLLSRLGPLGALPTAPRVARCYATVVLAEWHLPTLTDTAALIISELVTNAVAASTSAEGQPLYEDGRLAVIHFCLRSDLTKLLIEVWDSMPGTPVPKETDEYDEGGRGLAIVESVAERWGWQRVPDWTGKVIWALLRVL
jgi:anti-sigma regulatory factor (Ser/Thr protein kinase)